MYNRFCALFSARLELKRRDTLLTQVTEHTTLESERETQLRCQPTDFGTSVRDSTPNTRDWERTDMHHKE